MNDEENISYFFKLFKFIILIIFSRAYSTSLQYMQATSKQYFKVIFKQLEIHIYVKEILPILDLKDKATLQNVISCTVCSVLVA
jgi:hypothetical protein